MTKNVNCKFCNTPLTLQIDEECLKLKSFHLNVWLSMAACNRCADYREARRGIFDRMLRATRQLEVHQLRGKVPKDVVTKSRPVIESVFRRFSELVSEHYLTESPSIQPLLIETIIENPNSSLKLLLAHEKGIRSQPRQQQFVSAPMADP